MGGCAEVNEARVRRTEARSGDMVVAMFCRRSQSKVLWCYNAFLTCMMFIWVTGVR